MIDDIRWKRVDEDDDITTVAAISGYGEPGATGVYKLQVRRVGEWEDVPIADDDQE